MKKNLLLALFIIIGCAPLTAQVILDFESAATTTNFQYFGSDLEGATNNVIANPDASGANTSAMVADFTKPPASMVWAGAFANPSIQTPVDLTNDTQICIDVWSPETGNLALKLEDGTQGDWILTQPINETQTWVNLCFNTTIPSIEAPSAPAAGGVYNGLVLFFDFGTSLTDERVYYFDNIVVGEGVAAEPADVTFSVDMNEYEGTFNNVYVSGNFNNFSATGNPLTDPDGDGIYTATVVDMPLGPQEYKFQLDGFMVSEIFDGTDECTITSDDFTNRIISVSTTTTLPTVCWESCYACGEEISITINLAIPEGVTVSEEGLFIAGGGSFGDPGDYPLTDPDGDGIYSITIARASGFMSFYTFTNGACPGFDAGCKEDIDGQDCAIFTNFNDRQMGPLTEDTVISTCFGQCTETAECAAGSPVTFSVGMNDVDTAFTTVYLSGTFNEWSEDANPMTDNNGDGIWETTVILLNGEIEFKFQLDMWASQEQLNGEDDCTVVVIGEMMEEFVNRGFVVNGPTSICVDYGTCGGCTALGINDLAVDSDLFSIRPTLVRNETTLFFGETVTSEVELQVFNALGQLMMVKTVQPQSNQYKLEVNDLTDGLYFVNVETDGKRQTLRIVLNR